MLDFATLKLGDIVCGPSGVHRKIIKIDKDYIYTERVDNTIPDGKIKLPVQGPISGSWELIKSAEKYDFVC